MTEAAISLLVVDDEPALRRALARDFERRGFRVTAAASGNEGFALAQQQHFDAILTDVRMAGGDGVELLRRVKAQFPATAVTLITGFAEIGLADAFALGAEAVFSKPYDRMGLLAAMHEAVKPASERWRHDARLELELRWPGRSPVCGPAAVFGAFGRALQLGLDWPGGSLPEGSRVAFALRHGVSDPVEVTGEGELVASAPAPGGAGGADGAGRVELTLAIDGAADAWRDGLAHVVNVARTARRPA